ncbi:MAG: hypothetical protein NVSMB9_07830 [Isosphaeraceae bacterium]
MMRYALSGIFFAATGVLIYLGACLAILPSFSGEPRARVSIKPPPGGSLVICGGGKLTEQIRQHFIDLAGGERARIVVIPTADHRCEDPSRAESMLAPWKKRRLASVRLFHTLSRQEADDLAYVQPLTEATGVWLGGGKQSTLAQAYLGTEVVRQLKALLARGGVIGGTSAGAAVMSRVMITSGRTHAQIGEGFDLLPDTVIDQHFMKRNRMERMRGVVRTRHLLGLGIDEQTALVVDVRNLHLRVIGESYVVACVPESSSSKALSRSDDKEPVLAETRLEFLKPGDEADLATLRSNPDQAVVQRINLEAF